MFEMFILDLLPSTQDASGKREGLGCHPGSDDCILAGGEGHTMAFFLTSPREGFFHKKKSRQ